MTRVFSFKVAELTQKQSRTIDYQKGTVKMNESTMTFTVYMIHELANAKGIAPGKVYKILKQSGCIDDYLVPHYDVLHTMGSQYLMDDISGYVASRGGSL